MEDAVAEAVITEESDPQNKEDEEYRENIRESDPEEEGGPSLLRGSTLGPVQCEIMRRNMSFKRSGLKQLLVNYKLRVSEGSEYRVYCPLLNNQLPENVAWMRTGPVTSMSLRLCKCKDAGFAGAQGFLDHVQSARGTACFTELYLYGFISRERSVQLLNFEARMGTDSKTVVLK